jgi:hypothetical protein
MNIIRDTNGDITIPNPALITNLLAANGLNDCNPSSTPHIDDQDTSKPTDAVILTGKTAYQSTLGSCRFLADPTHPQLDFVVGSLGRYAHIPFTRHDAALKRVLRYLKGVQDGGLRFPHANGKMALKAYSDSNWAQCIDTRWLTTGIIALINGSPVHCISSKQPTIADSSTEAEILAANVAAWDLTWFQRLSCAWKVLFSSASLSIDDNPQREIIDGNQVEHVGTIALGIGSKGCVDIAHANSVTKLSKHLDKHKYIRQQVKEEHVLLTQISTADQKPDFLTKPLERNLFTRARAELHLTRW